MGEWLPGANRFPENDGGAHTRAPRLGVLHSTEGGGWPSYDSGQGVAPHLTVSLLDREVRQHIPFDRAARALRNTDGGVETNRAGVIQVELVGTCDLSIAEQRGVYYLPNMDDGEVDYLARILVAINAQTGVPLSTDVGWKDYNRGQHPSSYGADNGVRLSNVQWRAASGWVGHMHVPENSHGDPGDIPMARVINRARIIMATETLSIPAVKPQQPAPVTPLVPRETAPPATQGAPVRVVDLGPFPLPLGHWFGPESRDSRVHSGYYAEDAAHLARFLGRLRERGWRNVPDVDRFTPDVDKLVRAYQTDARLKVDGKLGQWTWLSAATSRVR